MRRSTREVCTYSVDVVINHFKALLLSIGHGGGEPSQYVRNLPGERSGLIVQVSFVYNK